MTDPMTQTPGASDPKRSGAGNASTGASGFDDGTDTVTRSAAVEEVDVIVLPEDGTSSSGSSLSGSSSATSSSSGSGGSVSDTASSAKDHAAGMAHDAKDSAKGVASTATSEAKNVAHEAKSQLRTLVDQLGTEANDQASSQTQRAVQGLRSLGDELSGLAQGQAGSGMATDLARQGADRLNSLAGWLEGRQPGEILDEVRSFARQRPGAFLAGAAVLGLLGGRMTRGLTADSGTSGGSAPGTRAYGTSYDSNGGSAYGQTTGAAYTGGGAAYATSSLGSGAGSESGDPYGAATPELDDPSRVGSGTDPATFTHPAPSSGVGGETR